MTMPPPPPTPPGWYPDPSGGRRYWDGSNWGPLTAPGDGQPVMPSPPPHTPYQPAAEPAKKSNGPLKAVLITGAVLLAGGAGVAALSNTGDKTSSSSSGASSASSRTQTVSPEVIARKAAEEKARLDPATYEALTPREFALIAKAPDAHVGEKVVLYGVVFQADAVTGANSILAKVDSVPHSARYEFDQTARLVAEDSSILANVVEDDFVTMWVEVAGSYNYDTQGGGNTTVPQFKLNIVNVTGSTG